MVYSFIVIFSVLICVFLFFCLSIYELSRQRVKHNSPRGEFKFPTALGETMKVTKKEKLCLILEEIIDGIRTVEDYKHLTIEEIIDELVHDLGRFDDIKTITHPVHEDIVFEIEEDS